MRLTEEYGDPKRIKNLWIAAILTEYTGLASKLFRKCYDNNYHLLRAQFVTLF